METEKSQALSNAEKKAIDASGHSEKQIDIRSNQAISNLPAARQDQQAVSQKSISSGIFSIFQSKKKKENVILEKK